MPTMDADLVSRLRNMAGKKYHPDWAAWVQRQCAAAADEIEQQRAVREGTEMAFAAVVEQKQQLAARVATLQASLDAALKLFRRERDEHQERRNELVAAWNDLPDALRCHPGLKRLCRAARVV